MSDSPRAMADQVRAFIANLHARRDALRRERASIEARREELLSMPLAREDVKQFILDYIDARAAEYLDIASLEGLFEKVAYPMRYLWASPDSIVPATGKRAPLCLRDVNASLGSFEGDQRTFEGGLRFFGAGSTANAHTDYAAYFFFGDIIKARIAEHFDARFPTYHPADAARIGPPIAERRAELQRLDEAAAAIDDDLAQIAADLAELAPRAAPKAGPSVQPVSSEANPVPDEAILRYNGRNEAELARKYGCSADALLAAWRAAEHRRANTVSGQGFNVG